MDWRTCLHDLCAAITGRTLALLPPYRRRHQADSESSVPASGREMGEHYTKRLARPSLCETRPVVLRAGSASRVHACLGRAAVLKIAAGINTRLSRATPGRRQASV